MHPRNQKPGQFKHDRQPAEQSAIAHALSIVQTHRRCRVVHTRLSLLKQWRIWLQPPHIQASRLREDSLRLIKHSQLRVILGVVCLLAQCIF